MSLWKGFSLIGKFVYLIWIERTRHYQSFQDHVSAYADLYPFPDNMAVPEVFAGDNTFGRIFRLMASPLGMSGDWVCPHGSRSGAIQSLLV